MIRQVFNVENYWKVIVYWNLDYGLFHWIAEDLIDAGISDKMLRELWRMMYSGKAKAVTFSNERKHLSIVIFNKHQSIQDYINSLVHEAEHVKQAMLEAYDVEDKGEEPAYTIGYLVGRMWEVFKKVK